MKKMIGWAVFFTVWFFIGYGIFYFGPKAVLLPGLSASAVGFIILGAIYWIRYAGKKELSQ